MSSNAKGTQLGAFLVLPFRDCLPAVGEPGRGPFTQAAKGTAAVGGGLFLRSSRHRKASFPCRSERKKGTRLGAFLLVARRGFEPLLPG